MSNYSKKSLPSKEYIGPTKCAVNACQIVPTHCDDNRATSESRWFCRWHYKAGSSNEWSTITNRINACRSAIDHYFKVKSKLDIDCGAHEYKPHYLKEQNHKHDDETRQDYLDRLWQGINNYILQTVYVARDNPRKVDRVKEFVNQFSL